MIFNFVVTFVLLQVDTYAHEYFPKVCHATHVTTDHDHDHGYDRDYVN